jgi:endonuclease/exonuclease/phosphatase family metal-dependent hydrolase
MSSTDDLETTMAHSDPQGRWIRRPATLALAMLTALAVAVPASAQGPERGGPPDHARGSERGGPPDHARGSERGGPPDHARGSERGGPPDHARGAERGARDRGPQELTVAQYNILDVRTEDLERDDNPRLRELAATIQEFEPDILLLNEIAYDDRRAHDVDEGDPEGQNAARFVDNYLSVPQAAGLEGLEYDAFMAPSNTGVHSGFDLNNNGLNLAETYDSFEDYEEVCPVPSPGEDGTPGRQVQCGRDWGDDSFGFGTFPGQYAMGLLVHPDIDILEDEVRTFQEFLWADMPGALLPSDPDGEGFDPENPDEGPGDWYSEEELDVFRLSSKSHWDVPVELPNGAVIHLLASHPTPPGFDGPEARNRLRNHDEIRFWGDYLDDADYIYDDDGEYGGLERGAMFIVMGDLNADDDPGGDQDSNTFRDPMGDFLLSKGRVNDNFVPEALDQDEDNLKADATAEFGIRADYVLPSRELRVVDGYVYGHSGLFEGNGYGPTPSDHYPVVLELIVPPKPR